MPLTSRVCSAGLPPVLLYVFGMTFRRAPSPRALSEVRQVRFAKCLAALMQFGAVRRTPTGMASLRVLGAAFERAARFRGAFHVVGGAADDAMTGRFAV